MFLHVAIAAALALPGGALQVSWGKPGVDFDTYRADAVYCASQGYYTDVSGTPQAAVLVSASRQIETVSEAGVPNSGNVQHDSVPVPGVMMDMTLDVTYNPAIARSIEQANRMGRIVQGARADVQMRGVGELLQSVIDHCLVDRGYHRFRLTRAQQRRLDHLRRGSPERHAFLFGLASDAEVLARQRID